VSLVCVWVWGGQSLSLLPETRKLRRPISRALVTGPGDHTEGDADCRSVDILRGEGRQVLMDAAQTHASLQPAGLPLAVVQLDETMTLISDWKRDPWEVLLYLWCAVLVFGGVAGLVWILLKGVGV
jgi:hypothetical protein